MAGFYVEERTVSRASSVSWDIARHLFTRQLRGIAVILTNKPGGLHAALTKQWYKLVRFTERERASTLDINRIQGLAYQVAQMQRLRFIVGPPTEDADQVVFLTAAPDIQKLPTNCHTLYVTTDVPVVARFSVTQQMPKQGLVVIYV